MSDLRLPKDLEEFLRVGLQLEYDVQRAEPGGIILHALHDLHLAEYRVDTWRKEQRAKDPNRRRDGHYVVSGVNLVAECKAYLPDGVLLWLPDEKSFGSWDCDHGDIFLFPEVTWSEIAANPLPYINGLWYHESVELEWLVPWPRYPFIEDHGPGVRVRRADPIPSPPSNQLLLFPDDDNS